MVKQLMQRIDYHNDRFEVFSRCEWCGWERKDYHQAYGHYGIPESMLGTWVDSNVKCPECSFTLLDVNGEVV